MTECTVAIFRACYQDAANMPSSVCEDEVYPIVEALGWNPPELNEIYFDYEQLIGHPNWSPDCDPNWGGCGNADPVDYYDYSGMGMDGMLSPSPTPMPSPYPYPGQWDDWTVSGDCVVHGPCVCSSNFVGSACNGDGYPLTPM